MSLKERKFLLSCCKVSLGNLERNLIDIGKNSVFVFLVETKLVFSLVKLLIEILNLVVGLGNLVIGTIYKSIDNSIDITLNILITLYRSYIFNSLNCRGNC